MNIQSNINQAISTMGAFKIAKGVKEGVSKHAVPVSEVIAKAANDRANLIRETRNRLYTSSQLTSTSFADDAYKQFSETLDYYTTLNKGGNK